MTNIKTRKHKGLRSLGRWLVARYGNWREKVMSGLDSHLCFKFNPRKYRNASVCYRDNKNTDLIFMSPFS